MTRTSYAAEARAAAQARPAGPQTARVERAYAMFELLGAADLSSPSLAERRLSHLTAFYSIETGRITVLVDDPSQPQTSPALRFALAHEYAHALQDQRYDLEAFFLTRQNSYDEILAARSVCEGEAQIRAALALAGGHDAAAAAAAAFTELVPDADRDLTAETAPLLEIPHHFTYDHGARFVDGRRRRDGVAAVDALFAAPPAESGPIFVEVELDQPSAPAAPDPLPWPEPPGAGSELDHESLGAAVLHGFAAKMSGDLGLARTLALAWLQDDFWIWDTGGVAALWRVRWNGARELCPILSAHGWTPRAGSGACRDVGTTTLLAASDDAEVDADTLLTLVLPAD